jgi:uncharacterized membrane protein
MSKFTFDAIDYLNTLPQGRVFSSGYTGYFIPYYGGRTAVSFSAGAGGVEKEKEKDIFVFYRDNSTETKLDILRKYNAAYVFYGPAEKAIGDTGFDGEYFQVVYNDSWQTSPSSVIYKVIP